MGYTRGLVRYGEADIEKLIRFLPDTIIDIISPGTMQEEQEIAKLLRAHRQIEKRLDAASFPKYLTELCPDRDFYDYAIMGREAKKAHTWARVKIGGVSIQSALPSAKNYGIIHKRRQLIVTGCNRGATQYTWQILCKQGLQIAHQGYGLDGGVGGGATAAIHTQGSIVIHQLREPLAVIRSVAAVVNSMSRIPSLFIGMAWGEGIDPILWAMHYWYYWNLMGIRKGLWTYRVEDMEGQWKRFCSLANLPRRVFPRIAKNINTLRRPNRRAAYPGMSWDILKGKDKALTDKIYELASRYGYRY